MGCRVLVGVLWFGVRVGVGEFEGSACLKTLAKHKGVVTRDDGGC